MDQLTRAVRGAIQVGENSAEAVGRAAVRLIGRVLEDNAIAEDEIISILFSLTRDLDRGNPATGLRAAGFAETALFCVQEAFVEGQLPRVVRVLVTYRGPAGRRPRPVYLDGAQSLRPDLGA